MLLEKEYHDPRAKQLLLVVMAPGLRRDDEGQQTNLNTKFSGHSSRRAETLRLKSTDRRGGDVMERRHFLKLAFGFAASGVALAASAQAAPLTPQPLIPDGQLPTNQDAHPAVTTGEEVDRLKPEEVRWGRRRRRGWGRGRHRGWGRRRWGWRRRRHWGWRRRWHRRRLWRRRSW
jgi:hypothetical protein